MMRTLVAAAAALALGSGAAAAMPEGRFATADGSATAVVQRLAEGRVRVEVNAPGLAKPMILELAHRPGGRVLEEPAAPLGWFDRLMSRRPERLPFDGRQLGWAVEVEGGLIVNTLQVDGAGRPDLRRALLALDDGDTLRLELWGFTTADDATSAQLRLARVAP
jgi:hypothetical protein